jgi:hypothetical protein
MRCRLIFAPLFLVACGGEGSPVTEVILPATDAVACVALGADYLNNVGTMAVVGLPSLTVVKDVVPGAISGDPVLRAHGGKLYVVNRSAANITVIDPSSLVWKVEAQFSTGAGSNPQDIALAGSKAYVTLYDRGEVQVWDLGAGGSPSAPARTIDISSYDEDGVPDANSVVVAGGRAFVTLDLLDTANPPVPRGKGKVLVIDTATDAIVTALELRYTNPYDFMYARGDRLIVATFADFGGVDGCLEQIALDDEPRTVDCLVENREVNGVINAIAVSPEDTYIAVSRFDASFKQQANIRRIDASGGLAPAPMTPAEQIPNDLAWSPTGHLVYSDVSVGGLRVHDLAGGREVTTTPLDIGLRPATANAIVCLPR